MRKSDVIGKQKNTTKLNEFSKAAVCKINSQISILYILAMSSQNWILKKHTKTKTHTQEQR